MSKIKAPIALMGIMSTGATFALADLQTLAVENGLVAKRVPTYLWEAGKRYGAIIVRGGTKGNSTYTLANPAGFEAYAPGFAPAAAAAEESVEAEAFESNEAPDTGANEYGPPLKGGVLFDADRRSAYADRYLPTPGLT